MTTQKIRITRSRAREWFHLILNDILDLPVPESYSDTNTLAQLGCNSLDAFELQMLADEEFGLSCLQDATDNLDLCPENLTVNQLFDYMGAVDDEAVTGS